MSDALKGSIYSEEFLDMEREVRDLKLHNEMLQIQRDALRKKVDDLEAKLVQRDVYEAEQRLPPEHAVLIKHLATVERCIADGPREAHYAEDSECQFCGRYEGDGHDKDCAWLALQFDRNPIETMSEVHEHALRMEERRERQRMPREPARPGATLEQMNNIFREVYAQAPMLSPEDIARAAQVVERSREQTIGNMRVYTNPNVAPGTVYLMNLSDFRGIPALRQEPAPVIHQSGSESTIALCGEVYSSEGYPPGSPTVTCPACLALLFPPKPEVP